MARSSRLGGAFAVDRALIAGWPAALRRHRVALLVAVGAVAAGALWVAGLPHNPPCCYADEPSTAWNAWTIAHGGRDEYGARWPLYFRTFGEFRSPVQIYVMAGLFKVLGAQLLLGRVLTRGAMFLAILLIGWLAARISGRRWIGFAVAGLGLTTPMLYEVSRLGTEAPLFDLPLAAFLAGVWHASRREVWRWWYGALLALPLGLLVYTYPIGRPVAPLLALGLLLFARRGRWAGVAATWAGLAVLMVPLLVFMSRHPGALTGYPGQLTWYESSQLPFVAIGNFVSHLARNLNPVAVLFGGDPNLRHHLGPVGAVMLPMWLLAVAGLVIVIVRRRGDAWWRFVVLTTAIVLVPATLTRNVLHTPRLVAVPLLGLLLCVPALEALAAARLRPLVRGALAGALSLALVVEVALFGTAYVRDGTDADRVEAFQGDFASAYDAAVRTGRRPIWLLDNASVHGFWQGQVDGVPRERMVRWLRPVDPYSDNGPRADVVQWVPPPGTVVVAGERCTKCQVLFAGPVFTTWIQR